jgi:hypothetical protein
MLAVVGALLFAEWWSRDYKLLLGIGPSADFTGDLRSIVEGLRSKDAILKLSANSWPDP